MNRLDPDHIVTVVCLGAAAFVLVLLAAEWLAGVGPL